MNTPAAPTPDTVPTAPVAAAKPTGVALDSDGDNLADDTSGDHMLRAVHLIALIIGLATCWAAQDLIVPIMLAAFLALLANPLVTLLKRFWVPRWLGALVVIFGGVAMAVFLASLLVAPAADWLQRAPEAMRELAPKVRALTRKVDEANKAAVSIAAAAGAGSPSKPAAAAAAADEDKPGPPNLWLLIWSTPPLVAAAFAVVLLSYFFLIYGDRLQRNAIDLLADRRQRSRAVDILRAIQSDVASYVLTISVINLILGTLTGLMLWWLGLDLTDAVLWGAIAGLLNYIPYIGPLIGVLSLAVVGLLAFDTPGAMLLPAGLYLGMQLLESEVITPIIVGRNMSLSPLVMLLWLMLWGWLWGIPGLLLAVPMLAALKIVSERVAGMQGWAKVIG